MCTASFINESKCVVYWWKCGSLSRNTMKWLYDGRKQRLKDITGVSVVSSCPVTIKVVISAAGVCAFRSCSAVGFCFF